MNIVSVNLNNEVNVLVKVIFLWNSSNTSYYYDIFS